MPAALQHGARSSGNPAKPSSTSAQTPSTATGIADADKNQLENKPVRYADSNEQ
jgi:hypothetical protein